ncbi:MAG TPA: nicotinate-nicotinamide nucleotide adenylyltransferase [Bryobacteraceae bacterium]|jgi:cytidyltransferase-like protein
MEFIRRAAGAPSRLGILPGTFNPVTVAHLALAQAGRRHCGEVLFVLPRVFPHKPYSGATLQQRLDLLDAALDSDGFSLAVAEGGLFAEIAEECRQEYGRDVRLSFLCGRDAAERIAGWDYGSPGAFAGMLRRFDLLVARRQGEFTPASELAGGVERLDIPPDIEVVSATEVRNRLACGQGWEHLVPQAVRERVREIYGARPTGSD